MNKKECSASTEFAFAFEDLIGKKSVISTVCKFIGIDTIGKIIRLILFIILTFSILAVFTTVEGRYNFKSVTAPLDEYGNMLGMSFLGDTMVWPFILLVPLSLILLDISINRSLIMFNRLSHILQDNKKINNEEVKKLIVNTKKILNLSFNKKSVMLKIAPWIIFVCFWTYNTLTCGFHDILGQNYYPYKNNKVMIIQNPKLNPDQIPEGMKFPYEKIFEEKINLPKWDTDRHIAPLSTWSVRIWTIFFYGLPPFILAKLIILIWGVTFFLKNYLRYLNQGSSKPVVLIKPFSEDGYCGLRFVANVGMGFFYTTSSFFFLVFMSFFKEGVAPSWHNYFLIIVLMPIAIWTFLIPTSYVKKIVQNAKDDYLEILSNKINQLFFHTINGKSAELNEQIGDKVSTMSIFYNEVKKMPVWPFSSSVFLKISMTTLSPILLILLEKFISKYVS